MRCLSLTGGEVERQRDRGQSERRGQQERDRPVNGAVAASLAALLEGAACAHREGTGGAPPSRPSTDGSIHSKNVRVGELNGPISSGRPPEFHGH